VQYIASAASVFLAISCLAAGQVVPGVLLCVGAVGGFADRLLKELDLYRTIAAWFTTSSEAQEKIVRGLEIGVMAVSLIAAIAGGLDAYQANAVTNVSTTLGKAVQTALQVMKGAFQLKEGHLRMQCTKLQSEMQIADSNIEWHYEGVAKNTQDTKKALEQLNQMATQLHKTIQSCGQAAE
jgi:hypothetical protein